MAIRIITSNAGACLGAALMASPTTANNPYLLAVLLCIAFGVAAHYAPTQFKLAGLLAVATMASVAGCQYLGCCGHHGSMHYFLERLVGLGHSAGHDLVSVTEHMFVADLLGGVRRCQLKRIAGGEHVRSGHTI